MFAGWTPARWGVIAAGVALQALAFATNFIWLWPVGVFLFVVGLRRNPEVRLLPRYAIVAATMASLVAITVVSLTFHLAWVWILPLVVLAGGVAIGFIRGRFSKSDATVFLKFAAPGIVLPAGMMPLFLVMAAGYVALAGVLMIPLFAGTSFWAWRLMKERERLLRPE